MSTSGSLTTFYAPRIRPTQSQSTDAALQSWMRSVTEEVNKLPYLSVFSFSSPNSNVSAVAGTIGQNLASGVSVMWVKQVGSGNTGWVSLA